MATLTGFLTGIANKLRENLGTSEPINATDFESKITESTSNAYSAGYGSGQDAGYTSGVTAGIGQGISDFWEAYQQGGTRTFYEYAFKNTNFEYIRPKYKIIPTSRLISVFEDCLFLKKIEAQYFDFSNATMTYGHYGVIRNCRELVEVEDIKMQAGAYYQTFNDCRKLETIAKMRVNTSSTFDGVFTRAYALKNITIEGAIGQSGLSFKDCPLLTAASIHNILDSLSTSATGVSITFNLANKTTYDNANSDFPLGDSYFDYRFATELTNWSISLL